MADSVGTADTDRFTVRATSDSHFSWVRTRLSLERTMMSWLRTATALIGFGFAIVQFFERLQQAPEAHSAYLPDAPILLVSLSSHAACSRLSSRFGNIGGRWGRRMQRAKPPATLHRSQSVARLAQFSTVIMRPHAEFGWAGLRHARYPSSASHPSR